MRSLLMGLNGSEGDALELWYEKCSAAYGRKLFDGFVRNVNDRHLILVYEVK